MKLIVKSKILIREANFLYALVCPIMLITLCGNKILYLMYCLGKILGVIVPPPTSKHRFVYINLLVRVKYDFYVILKFTGSADQNYDHNYYNVVISTRNVFAVIRSIISNTFPGNPRLINILKFWHNATRRTYDSICTLRDYRSIKATHQTGLIFEGNYTLNYYNVEISTRDVFTVIMAIMTMKIPYLVKQKKPYKVRRGLTRRVGEDRLTVKSFSSSKTLSHLSQTIVVNYNPNYLKMEISTRDDCSVITAIKSRKLSNYILLLKKLVNKTLNNAKIKNDAIKQNGERNIAG